MLRIFGAFGVCVCAEGFSNSDSWLANATLVLGQGGELPKGNQRLNVAVALRNAAKMVNSALDNLAVYDIRRTCFGSRNPYYLGVYIRDWSCF